MSIQLKGNDNSSFSDDVTFAGYVSAAGANFATDFNGTADTFIVSASQNGIYQGQISYDTNANLTGYAVDFAGQTPVPIKWKLSRDGSASFGNHLANNGVLISGFGDGNANIVVNRDTGSNGVWYGQLNGTTTSLILADGSATFSGSGGEVFLTPSDSVGGYYRQTLKNGYDPNSVAWRIRDSNGNDRINMTANGGASFSGNVTAPNTFLALDTGGTLDVRERLQNTQAILYRLKAALIQPDADVNTLRQRLLEALDILTSDGDES